MDQIRARIDYLKNHQPNWDEHGEQVADEDTFEFVYSVFESLVPTLESHHRFDIGLSDDGGIEVDDIYHKFKQYVGFTFFKNYVICDISNLQDAAKSQQYSCQYTSLDDVVAFVKKHIV